MGRVGTGQVVCKTKEQISPLDNRFVVEGHEDRRLDVGGEV